MIYLIIAAIFICAVGIAAYKTGRTKNIFVEPERVSTKPDIKPKPLYIPYRDKHYKAPRSMTEGERIYYTEHKNLVGYETAKGL